MLKYNWARFHTLFTILTIDPLTSFTICLWNISNGLKATESKEVSLLGNVYNFSVDYNFIDKSDIINIHKYLMTKNDIK